MGEEEKAREYDGTWPEQHAFDGRSSMHLMDHPTWEGGNDEMWPEQHSFYGSGLPHYPTWEGGRAREYDGMWAEQHAFHGSGPPHHHPTWEERRAREFGGMWPEEHAFHGSGPPHYPTWEGGRAREYDGMWPEQHAFHGSGPPHHHPTWEGERAREFGGMWPEQHAFHGSGPTHHPTWEGGRATEYDGMSTEHDAFHESGPHHLTHVDWGDAGHRRSVAACLVQATYVMYEDRKNNRREHEALAPAWWEFFGFRLYETLSDKKGSCFGAVFKLERPSLHAPAYVVAFRGTRFTSMTDLKLNLRRIFHHLHRSDRAKAAEKAVLSLTASGGSGGGGAGVWLAGHSLGSSVAMAVGKAMAMRGVFLESFLFNPPYLSPPLHRIKNHKVKQAVQITKVVTKTVLALAADSLGDSSEAASFEIISRWAPSLFVNPNDLICAAYINYFGARESMEDLGLGFIGRTFARACISATILAVYGEETEALHLLPSADLHVVSSGPSDWKRSHSIEQWWRSDLAVKCSRHRYHSEQDPCKYLVNSEQDLDKGLDARVTGSSHVIITTEDLRI